MMHIDEVIAVLEAARRGEDIEMRFHCELKERWWPFDDEWRFDTRDYRIAPKQMTLVERLRYFKGHVGMESICAQAADRIEELEKSGSIFAFNNRELLEEVKRRMV